MTRTAEPRWMLQLNLVLYRTICEILLKNLFLDKHYPTLNQILLVWLLRGSLSELYPMTPPTYQDAHLCQFNLTFGPYWIFVKKSSPLESLAPLEWNFGEIVT